LKKIMNKILIIFILLIILFEFPFSNSTISYAADGEELGLNTKVLDALVSLSSGIISIVVWVPKFIATALISVVNSAVGIVAKIEGTNGRVNNNITPYKIFFNKYKLLDVNVFNLEGLQNDKFVYSFRTTIATWYYILRLLATAILLVILIYVGIRMAIASVADEKAKYKKMLFDWAVRISSYICYALYSNFYYSVQ